MNYKKLYDDLRNALMVEFRKNPQDVKKMSCFLRHEKRIKGED